VIGHARPKQHCPLHLGGGPGVDDLRGQRLVEAPLPHIAELRQAVMQPLRRMRLVERVHQLGPRVTYCWTKWHVIAESKAISTGAERYATLENLAGARRRPLPAPADP